VPVFCGSAYKNKGVQLLLDGVATTSRPARGRERGLRPSTTAREEVAPRPTPSPFVGLAFKLEDGRYGQLTYVRVYQGTLKKGDFITTCATGQAVKVGRLVRMHSDEMEDIEQARRATSSRCSASTATRATRSPTARSEMSMTSMFVPDPVIHYTITTKDKKAAQNLSKALQRFSKEDPTFRVSSDPETGETIISGMGELHLDVYIERMRREYKVPVESSPPRVAYRETITQARRLQLHPQEADRRLRPVRPRRGLRRAARGQATTSSWTTSSAASIPREFIPSCDKGFRAHARQGPLIGAPSPASGRDQRRRVPRGRLVGHRVPGGRPRRLARGLPARPARSSSSRS
jgi:elongation factor G